MNDHVPDSGEHLPPEPWSRKLTLRAWPWFATLQRCAVASVVLGWVARRATSSMHGSYSSGWIVFGLLIVLRWIAGARAAFRELQSGEGPRHPRLNQLFYVVVPAELVGVISLLAVTLAAGIFWLLRRPTPQLPLGLPLEDRRKGFYNAFFAMNVVGALAEIPLSIVILPGLVPEEGVRVAIHCLELLLNLAILGDRWLVDSGGHILTEGRLLLRAGLRAGASVPISEISEIDVIPKSMSLAGWSRSRGLDPWDAGVNQCARRPERGPEARLRTVENVDSSTDRATKAQLSFPLRR